MKHLTLIAVLLLCVIAQGETPTTKPAAAGGDYPALRKKLAELQAMVDQLTAENVKLKADLKYANDVIATTAAATQPVKPAIDMSKPRVGMTIKEILAVLGEEYSSKLLDETERSESYRITYTYEKEWFPTNPDGSAISKPRVHSETIIESWGTVTVNKSTGKATAIHRN